MKRLFLLAVTATLLLAAPAPAQEEEIRSLQSRVVSAWNAGDLAGLMRNYAEGAVIHYPGLPPVEGRAAIEKMSAAGIASGVRLREFEILQLRTDAGLAVLRGRYASETAQPGGASPRLSRGSVVVALVREDNAWRIFWESWTPATP